MMDPRWREGMMELRLGMSVARPSALAKVTGVNGSKRAVTDALARLEEHNPEAAALMREHLDVGRSTDER